jgi:penicillin-binding protein 1A
LLTALRSRAIWLHMMPEMADDTEHDDQGSGQSTSRDPPAGAGASGTLVAGRAFLRALRDDLGRLLRRLGRTLSARTKRNSRPGPSPTATTPTRGGFGRVIRRIAKGIALVAVLCAVTLAGAMLWALHNLPAEKPVEGSESSLLLEAANGEALGRVGPLKMPDAARADFPDNLVKAVISIEDRRFYSHWGLDPEGILRALRRNIAAGGIVEGGSTITQQLVKMRFLGHQRTIRHKLREALVATWLDMHLGKDEILTRYLNSVYLGNGAYGMSAAARFYFDKSLSELTLPEAAMLAGMIRSPSRTNPLQDLEAARARANVVIEAMRDAGAIDAEAAKNAESRPATVHLSKQALRTDNWFADWVAREATAVTGSFSGNLRLRTTLIPELQKLAEQAIAETLAGPGAQRHASQAALVAMRPDGAVVAMVGGRNYQQSGFNRAIARRQPGSAFKLFVYLAALRKGFSPSDTIDASSVDIKGWEPENFGDRHYGRVTLAEAFAESINTAAARLAQQVGLNQVIAAARDLGIESELPAVPSLALGTANISLLELTAAYAAVEAGKMPIKPWGIEGFGIEGQPGLQSMGAPIVATQSLQAYQKPLLELLQDVIERGTGRSAALDGFAAGKTGTSQDYRDAWFIGFNDALVVGVWVGNDDGSPMDRVTGGSLPAAIWKRVMTEAPAVLAGNERPAAQAPPSVDTAAPQATGEETSAAPECDYRTCARAYQSFRASDCTYQPYGGAARERCDRHAPLSATATPFAPNSEPPLSPGKAQCNVDVCANFYDSFDPADCTYQPFGGGPRRLCDR